MRATRNRYAVCQNALKMGSLREDARAALASGAAALAVMGSEVTSLGGSTVGRMLDDLGLKVSSIIGLSGWSIDGRPDDLNAIGLALDEAAVLGSSGVSIVSGPAGGLSPSEADAAFLHRLDSVAPMAKALAVSLSVEPLHPMFRTFSFVHTLRHCAKLAQQIEGVKVVVDIGHLWWDPDLESDFATNLDAIATVQIADVNEIALGQQRYERVQLGQGDIPLGRILRSFVSSGYGGYFENEVICPDPQSERIEYFRKGCEAFARLWI